MLLAIDVGNTNSVVGVFDGAQLRDQFRIASSRALTADEAGFFITGLLERMKIANEEVDRVAIASVVPQLSPVFERTSRKYFGCDPLFVSAHIKLPISIQIESPDQLGADRIANGVAGYTRFGGPVIIVDFGTTTNFDVVDGKGNYVGGILVPGPETSLSELARKAARLFEVRIEPPSAVVGRNTAAALKSGLFYGTIGQVDFLVKKITEELGFEQPRVIGTGGLASAFAGHSQTIQQVEPGLTLDGIRLIADLNR